MPNVSYYGAGKLKEKENYIFHPKYHVYFTPFEYNLNCKYLISIW